MKPRSWRWRARLAKLGIEATAILFLMLPQMPITRRAPSG